MLLVLTPQGHLRLTAAAEAPALADDLAQRLDASFARGGGHGLLQLGAAEADTPLPAAFAYWREFGSRYMSAVCGHPVPPESRTHEPVPPPSEGELEMCAAAAPPMDGAEYLTGTVLQALWREIDAAFGIELAESKTTLQEFLRRKSPAWNLVGRVHLNLAENRHDEDAPFAFLATYTTRLSAQARVQHLPLGRALTEYAGAANRPRLLSLLLPVQRAAESCAWLRAMVDSGEIYHPLRWAPADAWQLLTDLPWLESAGVVVRVPGAWRAKRPPRPQVTATVGGRPPAGVGADALLDFDMAVTLDGERLTAGEIAKLLAASDGLHLVRGRWVELDRERLARMLDEFRAVERATRERGLGFADAMRLVAGVRPAGGEGTEDAAPDWSRVVAGPWLAATLEQLRRPETLARLDPGNGLRATLRPYQQTGVRWLHLLSSLGLGACLADDMGLGKTMQVLALLVVIGNAENGRAGARARPRGERSRRTSLLVAPASLLANWEAEAARFAPGLRVVVAHPSAMPAAEIRSLDARRLADVALVITSYGTLVASSSLQKVPWRLAVLDEAQAIKNPAAKQTRAVKELDAEARMVLTGTPVENRLGDLWSIFDFINPGLLGTAREFTRFTRGLPSRPRRAYAPIRALVRPYILRRLKTDPAVIADLPAKTEVKAFCGLSRVQAALYQRSVTEMASALASADGIKRKGVVLAFLMRLKQICNHPSHWLGDGGWAEGDSGKLLRLREIADVIAAKQEKVLVFTQFRDVTAPLSAFLEGVFGRPGLVLHGETAVKARQTLVRRFQEDEQVPFFVLSLKAGGTGLNLTAASHVVHFDRWWNPAVEDQATDRAFRIGQTKNVLVHKFLCRGTVEERIDALIESKRQLSRDLLEGGGEVLLTEMSDEALLDLVALDLRAAAQD
jgi:non-specific serine/threonine protein kinase